jgi:2-oxoglutarate/2-oxoacid ferredoxin oxidoreductase subunit alpha
MSMSDKNMVLTKSRTVIRFAGDSGDGMQLLGSEWVKACAVDRNDLRTAPDFPAEIRAPAGTLAGVSGFQIQFGSETIFTPGDYPDVLIALNPAALKANIKELKRGGLLIVNNSAFNDLAWQKAGFLSNPLLDESLVDYQIISIDMNSILRQALKETDLSYREIQKCKNFFCLGLLFWLYCRDINKEIAFIENKFGDNASLKKANVLALLSGYGYGENTEAMPPRQVIPESNMAKGLWRTITGNKALALGLVTASKKANLELFYASYPITPASDILHELARLRGYAHTFQMEDEMAAICAAIGASFAGNLSVTATSGPGFALKAEALGYAVMVELPLIVIDVQRAGPSTGMPTKTEQADLMQAIYGRSGEAPLPVLAAMNAQDCFSVAIDAARVAINFMTPVVILSDAFIANSSAPWRIVDPDDIPIIEGRFTPFNEPFRIYERDAKTRSRAWVVPGTKGLAHQIGGLEKNPAGKVSYDPDNHEMMVKERALKIEGVKNYVAPPEIFGNSSGDILLVGFGGTFGVLRQASIELKAEGYNIGHLHIRLVNPLHDEIEYHLKNFKHVVVIEHNQGQLLKLLRAKFLVDVKPLNKIFGKPFLVEEIKSHIYRYRNASQIHPEMGA